ncbi:MAG: recombinase family protein [Planctomycetota bacterium]
MRFVGYARTSWEEQEAASYPTVEAQERALREFAERCGIHLERVLTDTGISPKHGTCAGLVSILDGMDGTWEGVLVTSYDRLLLDTIQIDGAQELRNHGKQVLLPTEENARLLQRTVERAPKPIRRPDVTVRTKRRRVAERLLRGREAGARAGKHQSGPAPYGYRRDYTLRNTEGVLLVPDDQEADVVRMIFREYLRLRSMKRLIKLLDEQGLKTRRGKQWSRAGVSWILKNDTYVGRVHFGKIRTKGRHDSIVPPIMFNKVQKLIRENNKRSGSGIKKDVAEVGELSSRQAKAS